MIRISRNNRYTDRARAYKIYLDDSEVGEIKRDEQIELDVPPGKHQLYLKIDWCKSNVIEFEKTDGVIEFECGNSLQGKKLWIPFSELIYTTIKRNEYLWLKEVAQSEQV